MDIHKPRAAHSLREFVVEIGTITVGILIALGLESALETYRNERLVERARVDLRAELETNRRTLADQVSQGQAVRTPLAALLGFARDKAAGKAPKLPADPNLRLTFIAMSTAAWESAVATQVLVHMPYEQAHALTRVYAGTRIYNEYEGEAARRWIELSTIGDDPAAITVDEARAAARALALNQAYQGTLVLSGQHLLQVYDKALRALR